MSETDTNDVRDPADIDVALEEDALPVDNIVRLWAYRWVILAASVLGLVLTGVVYFTSPSEHLATLKFRLLFEGADTGTYPSGVRFSTEDIIARSVLLQVWQENKLKRYGELGDLQRAFYVAARPSAEMEALDSEYSSKLTNRKLTAVERTQLEQEYREKRAGLAHGVDYELTMDMSLGFGSMPDKLREKVVRDILATWARDAEQRKGALKYQMAVLTENVLPESILAEDYFIAADMLRLKVKDILDNIKEIMALPGAKSYRSTVDNHSLTEISTSLVDMRHFKLSPAMHLVRLFGLAREEQRNLTMLYIQSAIYNITLAKTETVSRAKALEDALTTYMLDRRARARKPAGGKNGTAGVPTMSVPAMIPQFGDSFLDRIIQMASESEDIKFRQDYTERISAEILSGIKYDSELKLYTDMLEAMQGDGQTKSLLTLTPEQRNFVTVKIEAQIKTAHATLVASTKQINAIYEQLSRKNLNPPTELYSAPEPLVAMNARAISPTKLLVYLVAIVAVMVFIASAACRYHARIRSQKTTAA